MTTTLPPLTSTPLTPTHVPISAPTSGEPAAGAGPAARQALAAFVRGLEAKNRSAATVRAGKGMRAREIELERRGMQALRAWLRVRPPGPCDALFTTRDGWRRRARAGRRIILRGASRRSSLALRWRPM